MQVGQVLVCPILPWNEATMIRVVCSTGSPLGAKPLVAPGFQLSRAPRARLAKRTLTYLVSSFYLSSRKVKLKDGDTQYWETIVKHCEGSTTPTFGECLLLDNATIDHEQPFNTDINPRQHVVTRSDALVHEPHRAAIA